MSDPSEKRGAPDSLRDKIIGLGERSMRKSYYPQLQQRLEEVEQARLKLAESEARYRHLLENVSDVIVGLDPNFVLAYVSPAVENLGGWRAEDLTGKPFVELVHPEDRELVNEYLGDATDKVSLKEFRFLGVDGDFRHARMSCRRRIRDGVDVGLAGVICDISERKKAEEERENLREQLTQAQKMESIGRLAGGVAHDFNNMLGVIIGHSEMLLQMMPSDCEYRSDLNEILHAGQRSSDLTRQLLAFARKQAVNPKVMDLNETVEGMLKMLRRLLGEDIDMAWLPGSEAMTVEMDPSQLDQILANLCVNARDAIDGAGMISIETQIVSMDEAYCREHPGEGVPGDFVMLTVTDNGCGMDKATLSTIFEPFFTTKALGKGTGLGLSTVYGVVKQSDGFVTVYSEPGMGTSFKVHLPHHLEAPKKKKKDAPPPMLRGTETVLLVEDEPALLKMVQSALSNLGYRVLAASSPQKALEIVRDLKEPFDLLLTDIVMPKMNGAEMAEQIEALRPGLPKLFMSGYADAAVVRLGIIKAGAAFLQKPFSMRVLAAKIRETLDKA